MPEPRAHGMAHGIDVLPSQNPPGRQPPYHYPTVRRDVVNQPYLGADETIYPAKVTFTYSSGRPPVLNGLPVLNCRGFTIKAGPPTILTITVDEPGRGDVTNTYELIRA
jgi:hypothetical protein